MSLSSHLQQLRQKHESLSRKIEEEQKHPGSDDLSDAALLELYRDFYAGDRLVHVQDDLVQTKAVAGSDRAFVTVRWDARSGAVVAFAAIDNLGKGAAGQAVQGFNVARGFEETLGLRLEGQWP